MLVEMVHRLTKTELGTLARANSLLCCFSATTNKEKCLQFPLAVVEALFEAVQSTLRSNESLRSVFGVVLVTR